MKKSETKRKRWDQTAVLCLSQLIWIAISWYADDCHDVISAILVGLVRFPIVLVLTILIQAILVTMREKRLDLFRISQTDEQIVGLSFVFDLSLDAMLLLSLAILVIVKQSDDGAIYQAVMVMIGAGNM
ncbi:hypothetical protein H8E77_04135 [bacterium]|nr:hypothetical protein [bacterium]